MFRERIRLDLRTHSIVQCLLPPVTALVGRRVHRLCNARNIQDLNRRILRVHGEYRHARLIRVTVLGEVRDIFLKSDGDLRSEHAWIRAVVICIRHVLAMQRRRYSEEVGIRVVPECLSRTCQRWGHGTAHMSQEGGLSHLIEIERVADEKRFGCKSGSACYLIRIAHGLAAIELGRVERVQDV